MKLFKRTSKHPDEAAPPASPTDTDAKGGSIEAPEEQATAGLYGRLKNGLSRTGSQLASGLGNLFLGKKEIDDELLEALEEHLHLAKAVVAAAVAHPFLATQEVGEGRGKCAFQCLYDYPFALPSLRNLAP